MIFAHLQISTAYSLLSSTISIDKLVVKAKELKYTALAITDQQTMYGVFPFYQACIKANIKPIIGLTANIESMDGQHHYPLVLLAKNNQGYQNLIKISSVLNTTQAETISMKWLNAYKDGLIAMTPGEKGEIEQLLQREQYEKAEQTASTYLTMFGPTQFYMTIQRKLSNTNEDLIEKIKALSETLHIPLVAANDVRYIEQADSFAFQCMTAIRDGNQLNNMPDMYSDQHFFKSQNEMAELFNDLPMALENTLKIVEQCNVSIKTGQKLLPKYPLENEQTAADYLHKLCMNGLKERFGAMPDSYISRLRYELDIIGKMGFNDYFLIVWDFMKYAKNNHILTGPGRGSAAGSLVAYVLGITDVDPIEHGLLFERFLNPERISMPDIDIDFPDHRRDEVIEYVANKYGRLHVAQIITFGTFAAKASIRDTARVFGLSSKEMNQLASFIPSKLGITLEQAYQQSEQLRSFVQASEQNKKLFEVATKIEGLPRHHSTHAAGVVISEQPLTEHIPVIGTQQEVYLTQYPMEDLEEIGLLKMDFLGLRNLSLLERVTSSIKRATGKTIDIKEIPKDDDKTFQLLQKGDTTGIFQLESDGMRKVLKELKPTAFEDIVAVNALYRPGPMDHIPEYIARKHGRQAIQYVHSDLESILKYTYGVIVYQEQIMQIASKMAGYSLGEADLLRRAVSKKNKAVLDQERNHFVHGAVKQGYDERIANETYDLIVRFANYGFNRSHAVAYSFIAWQLAYLKAHYPDFFFAALLTSVIGNEDKIADYISEAKQRGISILPPSINHSQFPFVVEKEGIRFSLAAIRGIGATALKAILTARKQKSFADLFDLSLRVSQKAVNRKAFEALIYSGALDEFGYDRAVLLATVDVAMEHAQLMKPEEDAADLFADEMMFQLQPRYIETEPIQLADKLFYEKQYLGLYLSDHPTNSYKRNFELASVIPIQQLAQGQRRISVGVYITKVRAIRTKKGDAMAFLKVSDSSGELEAVVFPDVYRRYMILCKEGEIVCISGNIENRNGQLQLIVNEMTKAEDVVQTQRILYLKVPDAIHTQATLHQLQHILKKYEGATPIILHYEKTKETFQLSKKDWVQATTECMTDLKQLLGEQSVILK